MEVIRSKKTAKLPGKEIRVWLEVADPQSESLEITGIKKIDLVDFWARKRRRAHKKKKKEVFTGIPSALRRSGVIRRFIN